jgi:hypothetical protein
VRTCAVGLAAAATAAIESTSLRYAA